MVALMADADQGIGQAESHDDFGGAGHKRADSHLSVTSCGRPQPAPQLRQIGLREARCDGVSFVQNMNDSSAWVERVGSDQQVKSIAKLLPGEEYHAWTSRGALLGTAGSKLYEWTPIDGGTWRLVLDMAPRGLKLSRIAISPRGDWIAIVAEHAQ